MTKFATQIANLHRPIDKALFRALSFLLAIGHVVLLMWEPTLYGEAIGGFTPYIGPLFVWAVCSGVIFGVGFTPIFVAWKIIFSPYFSLTILSYFTFAYLFV
ncbi:cyd operon protein YbgE [Vibrio sp. TH_r3]|uniref:cyd operon protein YbgE n=1 Tax=Vibrio sp. TH_r3 TaxID=3082084 RepID=UPI002954C699|nr:cyd operon protein YbgE [Vibrio sp. TH_r3]MDV7103877.1 cyd operon protein YbgE [Vibrio sp. TH_r3]